MNKIDTLIEEVKELKQMVFDLKVLITQQSFQFQPYSCEIKPPWVTTSTNTSGKDVVEMVKGWKYE